MIDIERTYGQIRRMAADAGVRRVTLFGSRARGTAMPKSDIDLAVEGCPDFPAFEDGLQNELWSLLELDVINLDENVSQELRDEIARDGVVLYEEI